ncbi:MAG: IclR family transcriptional regulator [Actinobacteria bacterium]|nr:IclR family transcriptional regulator [Actinomycetota bacterium]
MERALDLLFVLEKFEHPMGVSDLGRAAGIPKATAQRLLAVLERRGLVQKEQARYQLGAGIVPLARAFLTGSSLTRSALPALEELALLSGETTCLYVRQGFDRVVVQRVESEHTLRYAIRTGQRLPLYVGAAGLVLAAAMPAEELRTLSQEAGAVRLSTGETRSPDQLLATLDQVRLRGFAVSVEEREAGVISVAAPVTVRGRGTIAAISVAGPPNRMSQERVEYLTAEVRRIARQIAESYSSL